MKRGDVRDVTVDGRRLTVTYLGKGRHATAYLAADRTVYLFTVEDEYMKDVIVEMVEDGLPHVPAITRHQEVCVRGGEWRKVYSMPFYPTVTAADGEAWRALKVLKEAADRILQKKYIAESKPLSIWGGYFARDVIEDTRGKVPGSVTEALEALTDAGCNYGSGVTFEFGKRNIGVDCCGRIVFRDILFDAEKLEREMFARMKRFR